MGPVKPEAQPRPPGSPPGPLTHTQAGRELEDGSHGGCEAARGQAQARPPQEGALGSGLQGQQGRSKMQGLG